MYRMVWISLALFWSWIGKVAVVSAVWFRMGRSGFGEVGWLVGGVRYSLVWFGEACRVLVVWLGLVWFGAAYGVLVVWFGLVCGVLVVWLGWVWFGLVRLVGCLRYGLGWIVLVWC